VDASVVADADGDEEVDQPPEPHSPVVGVDVQHREVSVSGAWSIEPHVTDREELIVDPRAQEQGAPVPDPGVQR
jgi:hypothetical protein